MIGQFNCTKKKKNFPHPMFVNQPHELTPIICELKHWLFCSEMVILKAMVAKTLLQLDPSPGKMEQCDVSENKDG